MTKQSQRGFTLLEVLVATAIMGVAVAGILGALSTSIRNASRLTQVDRASLLAQQKMDELLVEQSLPRKQQLLGQWDTNTGWQAQVIPFEVSPGSGPGQWVLDRIDLQVWWIDGPVRRTMTLEGYRRGVLRAGDL